MKNSTRFFIFILIAIVSCLKVFSSELALPTKPLFVDGDKTPLVMLIMGRDHTLYYEAYNDASDLDGDGKLDIHYDPRLPIPYYGLFDSYKCYSYASDLFTPISTTTTKKCSGSWSGDFLNYLTTSRIDALRKVLYGGLRYNDSDNVNAPIITRAYIPKDAHSWGKVWDPAIMNTTEAGNLKISDYAPLLDSKVYFFASTTLTANKNKPLLRVLETVQNPSKPLNIWGWVSRESTADGGGDVGGIAGDYMDNYSGTVNSARTDYTVRVKVCVAGLLESNCVKYPNGNYKPTGILHDYGDGIIPKIEFGLISGSYKENLSGGVLRAKIGKLKDEIDQSTGQLKTRTGGVGIFDTLNKLKVVEFNGASYQPCGWVTDKAIEQTDHKCVDWGNPIGEMLFESMRYFAGAKEPRTEFAEASDDNELKQDSWDDPFQASGRQRCDLPINLIISDINPSYDSDQIPGSAFNSDFSDSTLSDLNVAKETKIISDAEGLSGGTFFIGDNLGINGINTPTAKKITDLGHIRGLSPQEPTKLGSFYAAGVAYYGLQHDLNKNVSDDQKARTMAIALASPLPSIKLTVGGVKGAVTLIPYAKSVGGSGINAAQDKFQPTNGIVDYYVESMTDTKGKFRINFEDVEQGADHDMDMIVIYEYEVINNTQVKVTLTSEYASGGIDQHAGYVISGTTADGLYLDVKDQSGNKVTYYLDTVDPTSKDARYLLGSSNVNKNKDLGFGPITRTFTVDPNKTAAGLLESPLYYAAKWGSFVDVKKGDPGVLNGKPDDGEWDKNKAGSPDNYFLVTNASKLKDQLETAFEEASKDTRSSTSMSYTSSQITNDSLSFDSSFEAQHWSGNVTAYPLVDGKISSTPKWDADARIQAQGAANRIIFTMGDDGTKRVFAPPKSVGELNGSSSGLNKLQIDKLLQEIPPLTTDSLKLGYVTALVNYLRGDSTYEDKGSIVPALNKSFRQRNGMLGDIVHSTPVYGVSSGDQQPFVIFGANDGMVHILNATTGDELFAYVPSTAYDNLYRVAQINYDTNHRFFVDGNIKIVTINDGANSRTIAIGTFGLGAQGAWALDLTNLKSVSATAGSANSRLLWEITGTKSSRFGYITNAPAIISAKSGDSNKWVAIFGNGYNTSEIDAATDSNGEGALLVVDVLTGTVENTLLTGRGIAQDPITDLKRPNSLTEPVVADRDLDGTGDVLYAGDLFGNVWKVDIKGKDIADWSFDQGTGTKPKPLFTAVSREGISQPITQRPSVAYHPVDGLLVMVGTGKYIETTDVAVDDQPTQTIYGIWDKPGRTTDITRSTLLEQSITKEIAATETIKGQRETSKNLIDWAQHDGWYLDLYYDGKNNGERLNSRIVVRNTTAAFTTLIPSADPCNGGGSGWYMEVGIYTGSNSYVGNNLVDHSALLDKIPSEPVVTFITNPKGDKEVINNVKINGGTPYESPGTTVNTGAISWQMLY